MFSTSRTYQDGIPSAAQSDMCWGSCRRSRELAPTSNVIAALWAGVDYARVMPLLEGLRRTGVHVVVVRRREATTVHGKTVSFARAWFELWRLLSARRRRVVHLHLDLIFAPLVCAAARCRTVIFSVHNDEPAYRRFRWSLWLRLVRRMIHQFVAITEHVNSYFRDAAGLPSSRVTTIYYGFPVPQSSAVTRTTLGLPEEAFVIGFVGRLTEQKNLDVLLTAVQQRPGVIAVLVGDGPDAQHLRDRVLSENIKNVTLLGAVSDATQLMPLFDVLCLPSLWEGLGVVLIEAMLLGVPVMGSRRGAIPEVLRDGECGLIFEPSVEGLVAALDEVTVEVAARERRARAARAFARSQFAEERLVAEHVALYRRLSPDAP